LITKSDLAFKVIAIECGFAESSTFYRAIARWFNMTPQALRQSKNK
jgi:AraC-like DNA-binding protein